jgi:hypothetical protein
MASIWLLLHILATQLAFIISSTPLTVQPHIAVAVRWDLRDKKHFLKPFKKASPKMGSLFCYIMI